MIMRSVVRAIVRSVVRAIRVVTVLRVVSAITLSLVVEVVKDGLDLYARLVNTSRIGAETSKSEVLALDVVKVFLGLISLDVKLDKVVAFLLVPIMVTFVLMVVREVAVRAIAMSNVVVVGPVAARVVAVVRPVAAGSIARLVVAVIGPLRAAIMLI